MFTDTLGVDARCSQFSNVASSQFNTDGPCAYPFEGSCEHIFRCPYLRLNLSLPASNRRQSAAAQNDGYLQGPRSDDSRSSPQVDQQMFTNARRMDVRYSQFSNVAGHQSTNRPNVSFNGGCEHIFGVGIFD
jgi:hypothetical protein